MKRGTALVPAMFARETSRHRLRQPDRGPGEQHEMRPAAALADPAQVLLDRLAMTGQPAALRAVAGRARPRRRDRRGRRSAVLRPAGPSPRPTRRDDDPARIRDGRVEQLDLHPDDRMQADGLGRADEADRAVQTRRGR